MSIHKVTAGSGYTYLTRQVAAQDRLERGGVDLAGYYSEKGEAPGTWLGSGLAGLSGVSVGDVVTAEQMLHLFGHGRHPLADGIRAAAVAGGLDPVEAETRTRLGNPYRVYSDDIPTFRELLARRMIEINTAAGLDPNAPGDPGVRARVRTEIAVELFTAEYGRAPVDEREIFATIAKHSRPRTTAVAGFDLTFSPVKSVSTLWAVAPPPLSAAIERAHDLAVRDALTFLERNALFTREGARGVRQVETRGLIGAAFTHRDSRAGDPDLHTHVAVANKVQAAESGKWLAIDGRLLYKANVAASETYNTALEHHLAALGIRFAERPAADARKRPVREVVGVEPVLNERWSSRRTDITARQRQLSARFRADHGRPPTSIEAIALAQQATLETRQVKHEPRSHAEQRHTWAGEAAQVLGSPTAVDAMVHRVFQPGLLPRPGADAAWVRDAAVWVHDVVSSRRAHWQVWHVRAEALRQVRSLHLPTPTDLDHVVDLLVDEVLTRHCVALTPDQDILHVPGGTTPTVEVPAVLRRSDGSSVYTIHGARVYSSTRILDAEARILTHAARLDGHRLDPTTVDLALLETAANGAVLNAGQAALVRSMATSGARLQLAIAPAGAGKTTALHTLTQAWTHNAGGEVVALAPSAAAADILHHTLNPHTTHHADPAPGSGADLVVAETLAKLAWHLTHPDLAPTPSWITRIGPSTLVLIDEAGMADTLTLDTVIDHAITRGASVRLIGDDQQLAAIGAGGILRDLTTSPTTVHLTELMRFTNPSEAAASLALRDGLPEAVGFYLDHGRLHIGDHDTLLDDIHDAWTHHHTAGVDAIMLAPTRDLAAALNSRARTHRLAHAAGGCDPATGRTPHPTSTNTTDPATVRTALPGGSLASPAGGSLPGVALPAVLLADGNEASVGDLVITRVNDRRLRTGERDWVRNGDRWQVTALSPAGDLTVRHVRHHRTATLPARYVTASVELGYATTIHAAQGVTADVSHTLLTGSESRQVAYTAATRGRDANHLYLSVVGDGDPHAVIRPEHTHPPTPTDLLEAILARDDTARSATTTTADATDPTRVLGDEVDRYLDAIHVAAEHHLGPDRLAQLETSADKIVPGITTAPAWPTLRTHLILAAANGTNPITTLHDAVTTRLLDHDEVEDPAATLHWRLTHTSNNHDSAEAGGGVSRVGPLPWLPPVPAALEEHPTWGPYLATRASSLRYAAYAITHDITDTSDLPQWARHGRARPDTPLLADITVWRAAQHVPDTDRRPTGPPVWDSPAARAWQAHLDTRLTGAHSPALTEWRAPLARILTHPAADPFTPLLAERLAAISTAGINANQLLHQAANQGDLPDDHQAAALWWRITTDLTPTIAAQAATSGTPLASSWTDRLEHTIGPAQASVLRSSPWWPTLVTVIDHALARGETLTDVLADLPSDAADIDPCQGLVWRTSLRNHPPAHATTDTTPDPEPHDEPLEDSPFPAHENDPQYWAATDTEWDTLTQQPTEPTDQATDVTESTHELDHPDALDDLDVDAVLAAARLWHPLREPLPPGDTETNTALRHAVEADSSPVTPERIIELNTHALTYYTRAFPGSWAQPYLTDRLRTDITGHPTIQPGYAPAGWTTLLTHLRTHHHATDTELSLSGLASTTRDGRLIDRFRDRLILPITRPTPDGTLQPIGFVARANPHLPPAQAGPKYLNTPDTIAFHKSNQLYTAPSTHPQAGTSIPVLVEGPLDAIAITTATNGTHTGHAPLGTALTEQQARHLATTTHHNQHQPVIAFDNDPAGHHATERAYWLLTQHGSHPDTLGLPPGTDPAEILTHHGPRGLQHLLDHALPLADTLITEHLRTHPATSAAHAAITVLSSTPPDSWEPGLEHISDLTGIPQPVLRRTLADDLRHWHTDPREHPTRHTPATTQPSTTQTPHPPPAPPYSPKAKTPDPLPDTQAVHRPLPR